MDDQIKTLSSAFLLAVVLALAGCGYTQQPKFQFSFLPPSPPNSDRPPELAPAPEIRPNLFLEEMPAVLIPNPPRPERRMSLDRLTARAQATFERGKAAYQRNDLTEARKDFDAAIDLMLDASDPNAPDRTEFEKRLDDMVDDIHRYDLAGLGASAMVDQGKFEKAPLEDILQMTFPVDPRLKDKVRELMAATVSQLPLSVNDTVLGYINYFSNRGHGTIVAATQRSGRYRPMIQRILDEEGVPQELIHLAQAESGFIPRAMSRKAAGGMWQFIAERGRQYNLVQTSYTDDRMDPEKATRAAARHLRDLYSEFGDWYLAIAAYNCGPVAVEKAVERTGYADFWKLRSLGALPAETTNYVPIILAMTFMEKNAAAYGLDNISMDPPLLYDTVELAAPTSLTLVSDVTDAPLTELISLNPAVLRNLMPAGYSLHVPKGSGTQLQAALQMIPAEHRDSWRIHRVASGETIETIGKRYGTSPNGILAANHLPAAEPREGDLVVIPAVVRPATPVRRVAARSTRSHTPVRRTASARHTRVKPAAASRNTSAVKRSPASSGVILAHSAAR